MKNNLELMLKNNNGIFSKNSGKYNIRTRRYETYEMLKKESENFAQNDTQKTKNM